METPDRIRQQRIVGGNLALDLINTRTGRPAKRPRKTCWTTTPISSPEPTRRRPGAQPGRPAAREARRHPVAARDVFHRIQATRAYLYDLFDAIARDTPAPAEAIRRLERDEAEALAHGRLVDVDGRYRWSWDDGELDLARPLWTVVHSASTLLTGGPLDRVKGCASCRFHFLDESKNRSRRWCSMEDCGKELKMRRHVARRASRRE